MHAHGPVPALPKCLHPPPSVKLATAAANAAGRLLRGAAFVAGARHTQLPAAPHLAAWPRGGRGGQLWGAAERSECTGGSRQHLVRACAPPRLMRRHHAAPMHTPLLPSCVHASTHRVTGLDQYKNTRGAPSPRPCARTQAHPPVLGRAAAAPVCGLVGPEPRSSGEPGAARPAYVADPLGAPWGLARKLAGGWLALNRPLPAAATAAAAAAAGPQCACLGGRGDCLGLLTAPRPLDCPFARAGRLAPILADGGGRA